MKVGDPPSVPTPIEICNKCGKREGYKWTYATDSEMSNGYGECKGCGVKYK